MDDPTPDDDRLLERLAAAGPVLDQLTREAAQPAPAPIRGRRHRPAAARPHGGGAGGRHRALIALIAVLAVAGAAAAVLALAGNDRHEVVRADTPSSPLSSAALAGLAAERADGVAACGPDPLASDAPELPNGWQRVTSFECATGYIDEFAPGETLVPVYAAPQAGPPIAQWSADAGWITLDDLDDPGFDFPRYRAAYLAELDARLANGSGD